MREAVQIRIHATGRLNGGASDVGELVEHSDFQTWVIRLWASFRVRKPARRVPFRTPEREVGQALRFKNPALANALEQAQDLPTFF
jgi:hypothetical protein